MQLLDRHREAQVLHREGQYGVGNVVADLYVLFLAADRGNRALGDVCMQPRCGAGDTKKHNNHLNVVLVGVVEDGSIVGVEGHTRGNMLSGEAVKQTGLHNALDRGVEDINDEGEEHWGERRSRWRSPRV